MERGVENSQNSQNSPQRGKRRRMTQQNGTPDAELRAEIFRYSMEQASPAIRPHIEHLCRKWLEFNETYFGGELVPPFLAFEEPGHTTCYGEYSTVSAFGGSGQIQIRPSLLNGTLIDFREGNKNREGLQRFTDEVLLHEMIHQWQVEVHGTVPTEFEHYGGHGDTFSSKANEIGARLGLPPVRLRNKKSHSRKTAHLPNPSQWPHNVYDPSHYLGAYVPASQDGDARLREKLGELLRRHGLKKVISTAEEIWEQTEGAKVGEEYPYVWYWTEKARPALGDRKGERCRVLVRGSMNSAVVEFAS